MLTCRVQPLGAVCAADQTVGRAVQGHPLITPRGVWRSFQTADGWLVIGRVNTARFAGLCTLMRLERLSAAYPDDASRAANTAAIFPVLQARFREETTDYWLERIVRHDIIGARVQSYVDVMGEPQAWANGSLTELPHPHCGTINVAGSPIQFGRMPTVPQGPPPELGQHTEQHLVELGFSWHDISRFREQEVILAQPVEQTLAEPSGEQSA